MTHPAGAAFTLINAQFSDGDIGSLRVVGTRIAALHAEPQPEDLIIDLAGDRLLPGLINAHDHLQLNSLPAHAARGGYRHVRDWIFEVDSRRRTDPQFAASAAMPRNDRLSVGGIKNLLSGVTTVAHHDPLYPFLIGSEYPVGVVRDFGWSHSLYIDGEEKVLASYRSTPSSWPWIIHAAEGLNEEAGAEFDRLDALGCIQQNALLVHGIALDQKQRKRLVNAAAGLVWCPSSNQNLFGKTADVADLIAAGRVALGTDSRLSGARDLLEELRLAGKISGLDEAALESLVTKDGADLLRLSDRGALRPGLRADLLVLPARTRLAAAARADVRLVMVGGTAGYGDSDCAGRFAPSSEWAHVLVDGRPKVLSRHTAKLLANARAAEPGLEISNLTWRAA
ncbi:MAG: amidohydrolase family protein [Pseudomonadota bacterium]|nr:amidohydrolase family protein [Pseudomonadota bacterium]